MEAAHLAELIARRWVRATLALWEEGFMHEKINVISGAPGRGGEYEPQVRDSAMPMDDT